MHRSIVVPERTTNMIYFTACIRSTRMDRMSLDPTPEEDLAFLPPPPPPLIAELQSDEQDTHDIYAIQARIPYESIPFEGYSLEDGEEDWNHHGNRSL